MPNRTMCNVLEEMRALDKTRNYTPLAGLIEEAAQLSEDENFKAYLKSKAADLPKDQYDTCNTLWLRADNSKIGFVIGFLINFGSF